MKGAIKMLRVSQWYTENEDRFVGLEDGEIDAMIDACLIIPIMIILTIMTKIICGFPRTV